jgi:WD40 repeat protein
VQKAAWSADGSRVVTIAQDATARVYDGATGEPVSVLTDPDDYRLTDVQISADGTVVVTAGFVHQVVRFWNADDGSLLGTIPRSTVDAMALSPDNSLLLLAEQGEGVELWSTHDASLVASYPDDAQSFFTSAVFSSDGSEFVTAGGDGVATVRAADGTLLAKAHHDGAVNAAAFSPDGKLVVTGSDDGTATVTDIGTGTTTATFAGHTGPVSTVAFGPTGDLVASGGRDGQVRLWRPKGGEQVAALVGHRAPVNQVAFNPAGGTVLSASDDSTARVWSVAGATASFPVSSATPVADSFLDAFSTGGRYVVVVAYGEGPTKNQVQTLDAGSGEIRGQFALGDVETLVPSLSADGALTVTTTYDATAIRSTTDGSVVSDVAFPGTPYAAAFDDSAQRVVVVGQAGQAGIYDVTTGRLTTELVGHDPEVEVLGAAFSSDGKRVLTAGVDGTARIWDAESGKQLLQVDAFGAPHSQYEQHSTVALSPDGRLLLTAAGYEGDANLWDARTGDHLSTLEGAKSDLTDVAFSEDGRFIVTSYYTGPVRLWEGHSGRLLATVTDQGVPASAASFVDNQQIALVETPESGSSLTVLDCTVCGDLDSLVALARTRVTRQLTDSEKATYLSGD